ncbi:Hypothetical predicted protein [Mytilus galloprovincialis]|uniref:Uncharacterized protein n=1 Tax=Mytilus galloprovincialis TaxID=29158 RepID=A0A8B6F3N9_MYTGA|nr:Hypothetical predicted protein [Mytilus galloprovincialis]
MKDAKHTKNKPMKIQFVKEGKLGQKSKQNTSGMLNQAKDWQLEVDLGKKLRFPDIVPTNLRPDMVLWSTGSKKERCGEANERKRVKYDELLAECRDRGWQSWNFPVEVGCRGFHAHMTDWPAKKNNNTETGPSSRESVLHDMDEERQ